MLRNNPIQRTVLYCFVSTFVTGRSWLHEKKETTVVQPTKKKDCPAKLKIGNIIKFPDFKVYK